MTTPPCTARTRAVQGGASSYPDLARMALTVRRASQARKVPRASRARRGRRVRPGLPPPDGYSLQPPPDDPDALICQRDGAPQPEPTTTTSPPAILSDRRRM